MKIMTMGFVGDGWEEHDTDDERDCNHCKHYDVGEGMCMNAQSDYYESNMRGHEDCDDWEEWKP